MNAFKMKGKIDKKKLLLIRIDLLIENCLLLFAIKYNISGIKSNVE